MYNFTINVYNQYDTDTILTDAVAHVYDNASGTELTAVGGVYTIDEGHMAKVEYSKTGYQTDTTYATISSDNYVINKGLLPTYTYRFQWKYYQGQNDGQAVSAPFSAWIRVGNETKKTCDAHNANGYCWFDWNRPFGTYWYVVAEASDYFWRRTEEFGSTVTDTQIPYTHKSTTTLITPTFVDEQGNTVNPSVLAQHQSVNTSEEYGDSWSTLYKNMYINKYILARGTSGKKTASKITGTLSGYVDGVDEHDFGINQTEIDEYNPTIVMAVPNEYADLYVTVTDKRTQQAIIATVNVENLTTGHSVVQVDNKWPLISNKGYTYRITVTRDDYMTYTEDITPDSTADIYKSIELQKIYRFCDLVCGAINDGGYEIPATFTVENLTYGETVEPSQGVYELIYNDGCRYQITTQCEGYYSNTDIIEPTTADDITHVVTMQKIPAEITLTVELFDGETPIMGTVAVYHNGEIVPSENDSWTLTEGQNYTITATATGYEDYTEQITAGDNDIQKVVEMEKVIEYAPLTVMVTDQENNPLPATIIVYDQTEKEQIISDEGKYYMIVGDDYDVTAVCDGFSDVTTDTKTVGNTHPITVVIKMTEKVIPFATIKDFELQTGKTVTDDDEPRVQKLLEDVSDLIREEGYKVGIDVDVEITKRPSYATVVKMVTIDVTNRVLNQTEESNQYSQESQSALGYSWSGTYAVAGGGVTMSLMHNELKRLGFNRIKIGSIQLWHI